MVAQRPNSGIVHTTPRPYTREVPRSALLANFKAKVARRMTLETQRLTATEPGALEKLLSEERVKQEDE
jgi:hypothetical protein